MAEKYQFIGMVDPKDRTERVQYAKDQFLELMGEPKTLTDSQVQKMAAHVQLRRIGEGDEALAEFGPSPEDLDAAKDEDKPTPKPSAQGRS